MFCELLRRVRRGETVVIAHAGRPVAKLVPYRDQLNLQPGAFRLSVYVDDNPFEPGPSTPTRSSRAAST
jgi:prevent-host-death family protein